MRVALVLYGQPRHLDNPHTIASQRQFILDRYDTDVFCHTWWSPDVQHYEVSEWAGESVRATPDALGEIRARYQPKELAHEPSRDFAWSPESQVLLAKFDAKKWTKTALSHNASHFYSLESAVRLVPRETYDFIVVTRVDCLIIEMPDLKSLSSSRFYVHNQYLPFADGLQILGDKFLPAFDLYSRSEGLLRKYHDRMWEPCAEAFKYFSFVDSFDPGEARYEYMPYLFARSSEHPMPAPSQRPERRLNRLRRILRPELRLRSMLGLIPRATIKDLR